MVIGIISRIESIMGEQGERTCWAFFFSRLNDRSISRKNQDSIERTSSVFPDSVSSHAFPSDFFSGNGIFLLDNVGSTPSCIWRISYYWHVRLSYHRISSDRRVEDRLRSIQIGRSARPQCDALPFLTVDACSYLRLASPSRLNLVFVQKSATRIRQLIS